MLDRANFKTRYIHQFSNQPAVEQQLVQAFFADHTGFYVDVGANDPVLDSQSEHLEALGWTGLLIEPDPDYCDLLRKDRRGAVVQLAWSSPENAGEQLMLIRVGPHSTLESKPIALGLLYVLLSLCSAKHLTRPCSTTMHRLVLICCLLMLRVMNWWLYQDLALTNGSHSWY